MAKLGHFQKKTGIHPKFSRRRLHQTRQLRPQEGRFFFSSMRNHRPTQIPRMYLALPVD